MEKSSKRLVNVSMTLREKIEGLTKKWLTTTPSNWSDNYKQIYYLLFHINQ